MYLLLQAIPTQSPHRFRTKLIFNNDSLCASHLPVLAQRSIVIIVLSERKSFLKRRLARQTYGSIKTANNIAILGVVFMLGNSDASGDKKIDFNELEAESNQFGDIIMGDFVDSYKNLTLKSIMAYEWLTSFCREAEIVVKTDDDVLINIFYLTEEIKAWSSNEVKSSNIWCCVHWNESIMSNINSKFYASLDEFPKAVFPTHCAGVGYIAPIITIVRIANEISRSFSGRVCSHEDVFMTGIVPRNIKYINFDSLQNGPIGLIEKCNDWIIYLTNVPEIEQGDDAKFILKLLQKPEYKKEDIGEFRRRFRKKIFYLLHRPDFERRYLRLWQLITKTHFEYL